MNATFRTHERDGLAADDVRGICDAYSPDCSSRRRVALPWAAACDGRAFAWSTGLRDARLAGPRSPCPGGRLHALSLLWRPRSCSSSCERRAQRPLDIPPKPKAVSKAATAKGASKSSAKAPGTRSRIRRQRTQRRRRSRHPADDELAHRAVTTIPRGAHDDGVERSGGAPHDGARAPARRPRAHPVRPCLARASATDVYLGGGYRAFVLPRMLVGVVGPREQGSDLPRCRPSRRVSGQPRLFASCRP